MKSPLYYVFAAIILSLSSCASAYFPSVVNVPIFEDKKELILSGHWGNSGVDLQSAYSPTNHLGLLLNLNFNNPEFADLYNNNNRHFLMESGLGYHSKLGDLLHFSCYGGGAFSFYNRYENDIDNSQHIKGNYLKFFFQPSLGLVRDKFKGQYILRFVSLRLKDDSKLINSIMIEPALSLTFGNGNYQYILQGGFSMPIENYEEIASISNMIFFSIGWKYSFHLGDTNKNNDS